MSTFIRTELVVLTIVVDRQDCYYQDSHQPSLLRLLLYLQAQLRLL